jgi:AraC-like DNA-binding protein
MPALQLNILLLSLGVIHGLFLFFLLFKKRKSLPGHVFLAAYLAVMLLQVTMKITTKLWLMQNLNPLYQFSYQLPFLYGPLLYLFVCRFTGHKQVTLKDILHFIPGIIVISIFILLKPHQHLPGIFLIFFEYEWTTPLQVTSILTYHLTALSILKKHSRQLSSKLTTAAILRMKWVRQLTIISMIVCSVIAVIICLMYFNNPHWRNVRFGFVLLTVFIYWISYKAWSQPELFTVIRGYSGEEGGRSPVPMLTVHLPVKKYSNSGLSEEEMQRIITALENKMQADKPYLDAQLTIDELAASLNCSRHHLSQAMNEKLDKSFYDCINHYRVEEAKLLLTEPAKAEHKIASIAYDSGFNSISTFNDVFKKMTGVTPSQYRKQSEEKKLRKQRV